ncbi:hypothetical protein [Bradyrhizobium sp. LHD-71]|uniref:hypothetical protein n=1 Tax=Bradyrhizobium sp. LHD-71 TaxID=3072141 RepID=UPI00280C9D6A|nr:hypothetical protein [Bradyrhizobium sp. LHD-71]MDQ8732599.1 hypothetical protein [Bradyrhizobium sp. LHD-71]
MSTDFSVRPVGVPAQTSGVRPAPEAAREAVRTQLPPAVSVTASETAKGARGESVQLDRERLSRQMVFDQDSAQLVYRVVDSRTENVVAQVPDEARRRRTAYFRELERAREESHPHLTDRTV